MTFMYSQVTNIGLSWHAEYDFYVTIAMRNMIESPTVPIESSEYEFYSPISMVRNWHAPQSNLPLCQCNIIQHDICPSCLFHPILFNLHSYLKCHTCGVSWYINTSRLTQINSRMDSKSPRVHPNRIISYSFHSAPLSYNLHSYLSLVRVINISRFTQIKSRTSDKYLSFNSN